MANLLFLPHRLPYPPNKGDKLRSYHLLKALAREHRVFLGTFIDDPEDEIHIDAVKSLCSEAYFARLNPRVAKLRSLKGLVTGEALTLPYYRDSGLHAWVKRIVKAHGIETAVVFSSSMTQYARAVPGMRMVVDFVDVDSAKWSQYAAMRMWPLSWIYHREGVRLLAHERAAAAQSVCSFFVTAAEAALFLSRAPECQGKVEVLNNGVDADYFSPDQPHASPYRDGVLPLVFTGVMDYWPNVDAVQWFVSEVMPQLRIRWPKLQLYIVGMRPAAAVRALAGEAVVVTGAVPDVRPFLKHAAIAVAPLRVARGIQNKVLEAMAMGLPVITSRACADAIDGIGDAEIARADSAGEFVDAISGLLSQPERARAMGATAREHVVGRYSWERRLSGIECYLSSAKTHQQCLPGQGDNCAMALR